MGQKFYFGHFTISIAVFRKISPHVLSGSVWQRFVCKPNKNFACYLFYFASAFLHVHNTVTDNFNFKQALTLQTSLLFWFSTWVTRRPGNDFRLATLRQESYSVHLHWSKKAAMTGILRSVAVLLWLVTVNEACSCVPRDQETKFCQSDIGKHKLGCRAIISLCFFFSSSYIFRVPFYFSFAQSRAKINTAWNGIR